jgi:hypothetical protein
MNKTSPVYLIRLKAKPGTDGIKALRAALKILGRRFGLRAVKIEETSAADNEQRHPAGEQKTA